MKLRHLLPAVIAIAFLSATHANAQAKPDSDYLQHALEAEQFINAQKVDLPDGVIWRTSTESKDETNRTFYHGSGGIALFYVELHQSTGEQRFLDLAAEAGNEIVTNLNKSERSGTISMYSGLTADVFVLNELYKYTKDEKFLVGARDQLQRIKAASKELGAGIGWIEQNPFAAYNSANTNVGEMYDLTIGAAGVGELFLYAQRTGLDNQGTAWARKVADRLLEVAEETPDGLRWPMMDNLPAPYIMPNFSHGPAGIAYFLADIYTETKDQKYLDAALSATRYVESRAVKKGDGILVTHHESPEPADLFYLSTCHGPAGTGRLMFLLNQITGDQKWMDWIDANLRGLDAVGAPEERSPGLWNNYGQCCGDSGLGEYALYLYRATGNEEYRNLARRIAKQILSVANKKDGKLSWTTAEMRIKPEFTQTQTGYMQGAAGMGSFFLHLATVDNQPAKISLLATPFK
jgi:lantibiotic modifying enzyme